MRTPLISRGYSHVTAQVQNAGSAASIHARALDSIIGSMGNYPFSDKCALADRIIVDLAANGLILGGKHDSKDLDSHSL